MGLTSLESKVAENHCPPLRLQKPLRLRRRLRHLKPLRHRRQLKHLPLQESARALVDPSGELLIPGAKLIASIGKEIATQAPAALNLLKINVTPRLTIAGALLSRCWLFKLFIYNNLLVIHIYWELRSAGKSCRLRPRR